VQVRGGGDPLAPHRDQGQPLGHPGADEKLAWLALQVTEHGVHRHAHARHNGRGVGIYQVGQLFPVTTAERAHLDTRHEPSSIETIGDIETPTGPATGAIRAAG
jgi:hypothetical protein